MTGTFPSISIVIPMQDEAANVLPLMEEIQAALSSLGNFEVIAVDDVSKDDTRAQLIKAQQQYSWLRILTHEKKGAQSGVLRNGIRRAKGELIITLDGDRQNDPADIPKFLKYWQEHAKDQNLGLIAGIRVKRRDTIVKRLSSRIANTVRNFMLKDGMRDTACGLKLIPRDVFLSLPYFNHMHRYLPALVLREGWQYTTLPVNDRPRQAGRSKMGVWNRLWVGIVDLFGVMWLIRRSCKSGRVEEISGRKNSG